MYSKTIEYLFYIIYCNKCKINVIEIAEWIEFKHSIIIK